MDTNILRKVYMKTITKSMLAGAVALALVTVGTEQARAWPVAPVVVGSVAAGAVIGATVASATAPAYYAYPGPVVAPPVYAAPVCPAPVVVRAPVVCYPPTVVVGAPFHYWYPGYRGGYAWGPRYHYGYGYRGGYRR
jgi:hypothetical protein